MNNYIKNYTYILFLLLLNITIAIFNKSNDYISNINFDFNELIDNDLVYSRGALFFSVIALLSKLINSSIIIFCFYTIAPIFQLYLFRKLIKSNILICLSLYFPLIFYNQDLYLLKMEMSQIFILFCLNYSRIFIFLPLAALFHFQSITIIFGFFVNFSRIFIVLFSCIFFFFLRNFKELLNHLNFYTAYTNDEFYSSFNFSNYNSISLLLILLYLLISFSKFKVSNKNSIFLERFIDISIIFIFFQYDNIVVSNRLLDFLWIFIIIYIGLMKKIIGIYFYLTIFIVIFCFIWSTKFLLDKILLI